MHSSIVDDTKTVRGERRPSNTHCAKRASNAVPVTVSIRPPVSATKGGTTELSCGTVTYSNSIGADAGVTATATDHVARSTDHATPTEPLSARGGDTQRSVVESTRAAGTIASTVGPKRHHSCAVDGTLTPTLTPAMDWARSSSSRPDTLSVTAVPP